MKANLPFCVAVEFSFDSVRALHATRIITLKPKGEAISAFVMFFFCFASFSIHLLEC